MKKNKHSRAFWQKTVLSALCVVLTLILVGLIFVTAYAESLLNKINRPGADYTETYSPSQYRNLPNRRTPLILPSPVLLWIPRT